MFRSTYTQSVVAELQVAMVSSVPVIRDQQTNAMYMYIG